MGLKACKYNFFFKANSDYYLAYNSFSNSFARITNEEFPVINEILENPNRDNSNNELALKYIDKLKEGSFLIDDDIEEVEFLKMRNKMGRFSTDYLGLTISPTLDCNFRCQYCFEERKLETMSNEVIEALIQFVKKKVSGTKALSVVWFGGEPLLRIDIIEKLTKEFKKLCKENKVNYSNQSIVTNGYLLDKEMSKKLKELDILDVQITLDGPPEVHDGRRVLSDGTGTFDTIIKNIKNAMDLFEITVRINVDKDNFKELNSLFELIEKENLSSKVFFYLGRVVASTNSCADIASKCFSVKNFSSFILKSMKDCNYKILGLRYPGLSHNGVCCADSVNSYVVAPSGNLFKCWSEASFDEKNSIGNILDENIKPYQIKNLTKYLNWDPFTVKKCLSCKYFPICGGGCPYFAINDLNFCTLWKYYLKEMLLLQYQRIYKK